MVSKLDRYSRQTLLPEIGTAGQERLLASSVAVLGCGALGTVIASTVVRAGVGHVRIIDRDYIELNNLQRQILFDEEDIARGLPKAIAAAEKLQKVNSQVQVEPVVADVNPENIERLIGDANLVLDGTDNFEIRFLLNDACVKHGIPWVYGGVLATYGMVRAIIPHQTPCFRCLLAETPVPGSTPTCDTVGVLSPAVNVVASLEVVEGLKILTGKEEELYGPLLYVDVWAGTTERVEVRKRDDPCPVCDLGRFEFLEAREGSYLTSLCGREAVQVNVRGAARVSFPDLAKRLDSVGQVSFNDYMLRFQVDNKRPYELTVFPDGRTIVKGTTDEAVARTLYARYIGL
jgi:molybdopterin/thiamine biosynthesis adenylyltransferase